MTTEVEHKLNRTGWPAGSWDKEPDKLNWTTEVGLPGMIVRNHWGALCGYVAVNPGHPLHGKDYDTPDVNVHCGLTYANACQGVICHVPEPGQPDNVWWFGFDCNHGYDYAPGLNSGRSGEIRDQVRKELGHPSTFMPDEQIANYKTVAYVRREVESLAKQLNEVYEK